MATLTILFELESVSIKSFFQREKWKRGLVSTIDDLPHFSHNSHNQDTLFLFHRRLEDETV